MPTKLSTIKDLVPQLDHTSTVVVGGSWSNYLLTQTSYTVGSGGIEDKAWGGVGIQEHATNVGRNSGYHPLRNESRFSRPPKSLVWPVGANDYGFDIAPHGGTAIHNILAVAGWYACGSDWTFATGATTNAFWPDAKITADSAEGAGTTSAFSGEGEGWYLIYFLVGIGRTMNGKIVEGSKRVDLNFGDKSVSRNQSNEIIALPYYSETGTFDVELWKVGGTTPDGVRLMGGRKAADLKDVVMMREI